MNKDYRKAINISKNLSLLCLSFFHNAFHLYDFKEIYFKAN